MVILSDESQSIKTKSQKFNNLSSVPSMTEIVDKIKQAHIRRKSNFKHEDLNIITTKLNNEKFFKFNAKKLSADSDNKCIRLTKRLILQEKLFTRQCQLPKIQQVSASDRSESKSYKKSPNGIPSLNNDHNSDQVPVKNVLHLQKPLINYNNESVYYNNYGRRKKIDWTLKDDEGINSETLQNLMIKQTEREPSNKIVKTSTELTEANANFVNFVENSVTEETVYSMQGNIKPNWNASDSSIVYVDKMVKNIEKNNVIISKDIKQKFEPATTTFNTIDMIQTSSMMFQNGKYKTNYESELQEDVKAPSLNQFKNNSFEKLQNPHNPQYRHIEKWLVSTNDRTLKEEDDDKFSFIKLDELKSVASVGSKNSNDNEMIKLQREANSKNSDKTSLCNKFKEIYQRKFVSDVDDLSLINDERNLLNKSFCPYKSETKVDHFKTELKGKAEINKETRIDIEHKNKSNDDVLNKNENENVKSILNESIKIKQSSYFTKLLSLANKIDTENEKENNTIKVIKKSSNVIVDNIQNPNEKNKFDQIFYDSDAKNNTEGSQLSLKTNNDNGENLMLINEVCTEFESHNLSLKSENNSTSEDSDNEFDFVNFENFTPFINLVNEIKNISNIQKAKAIQAEKKTTNDQPPIYGLKNNNLNDYINVSDSIRLDENSSEISDKNCLQVNSEKMKTVNNQHKLHLQLGNAQKMNSNSTIQKISGRRKKMKNALKNYSSNTQTGKSCKIVQSSIDEEQKSIESTESNKSFQIFDKIISVFKF